MEVNPWLLGGNPVVSPEADKKVGETLLKKAVQWAQNRSARSISLTILLEEDESANQIHETYYTTLGFPKLLRYVEMKCDLSVPVKLDISLPTGIEFVSLADAKEDELYICYLTTFQQGDAKFFFTQSENERRDYFNSLGLEDARGYTGSSVLQKEGQLIGFTYVLPYGEGNGHISCMCIHPDYQGKGLGRVMLHNAMHAAHEHGLQSMTLGTEVGMRAFNLYKKNGFDVLGGAVVFEREP